MNDWIPSFLDEMSKLAVALNKEEKRRQALQFGALGLIGGPAIGALYNTITRGQPMPVGVKSPWRWLAGTTAAGLATSGAIPVIQQQLTSNIQESARARMHRARMRAERKAGML